MGTWEFDIYIQGKGGVTGQTPAPFSGRMSVIKKLFLIFLSNSFGIPIAKTINKTTYLHVLLVNRYLPYFYNTNKRRKSLYDHWHMF